MLKQQLKNRKDRGFTIIEVLIVLAIAGLILLIVFLAVPALERNARNTSRKEDVGNILAGVSQYKADNNGILPTDASVAASGALTLCQAACASPEVVNNVGYYKTTANYSFPAGAPVAATVDTIQIKSGYVCVGSTPTAGGGSTDVIVVYAIETGGAAVQECQGS